MRYFSKIIVRNNPKNRLESDMHDYLKSKERLMIDESVVEDFIQEIKDKASYLSGSIHPRCKPINVNAHKGWGDYDKDCLLYTANMTFALYAEQEVCHD
jgi:hypothetical protein